MGKVTYYSRACYKVLGFQQMSKDFPGLFIRHILLFDFTRIRHYGFLSSASKKKSLALIRKVLKVQASTKLTT